MKNWWRKWSYEIPLTIGDSLWEVMVVRFADFLSRLTVRRVIEFFVIAMFAMAFAQTFPIDLAILFAGDTLMYLEFIVMIRLVAGREHFWAMLRLAARLARLALRVSRVTIDYSISRINRLRERRTAAHPAKPRKTPDRSDNAPGFRVMWGVLTPA